jgi:serine/threonine protein kinase
LDVHQVPPFVAFAGESKSLATILLDSSFIARELEAISKACVSALVSCSDVGIFVNEVTRKTIRLANEKEWQLDVSDLDAAFDSDGHPTELTESQASVTSKTIKINFIEHHGTASGLHTTAKLIEELIDQFDLRENLTAKKISHIFSDCLHNTLDAMPSAREVLKRLESNDSPSISDPLDNATNRSQDDFNSTLTMVPTAIPIGGGVAEGSHLGHYLVKERLGTGGMGAVYRAEDLVDNQSVAIKVLHKRITHDPTSLKRFAKEARLLAKANNPFVAQLLEVVSETENPYMVVELIEGGTLADLLTSKRPLSQEFTLTVMLDAIRGLAIAHSRGVIHRDFKPSNVLLTEATKKWITLQSPYADDTPAAYKTGVGIIYAKVSDFGLARTDEQSDSLALTTEGALMGTPLYMSPEQCLGLPTDSQSDIYSIGVTLFHLLAGSPPFEADTQVALLNQHLNATPQSLKKLRPDLSDSLVQVIEKCLAKKPKARYAHAGELAADLENILKGTPTSLGMHPPILALDVPGVMRFEHSWELACSPHQLWPYVSNTDRVNHAMGLPAVTYSIRQDPIYGTQRFATAKVSGVLIRWQEHPYEWIEGRRFSVLREFTHGPFRWFVNIVELSPSMGGGTLLTQKLIVLPRNWLGKQLAKLQLGKKSQIGFGRTYKQIDQYIANGEEKSAGSDPFIGRTDLRPSQRDKLHSRLEQLKLRNINPIVVDTLGQFLEYASDIEVSRIRPIALAERFQLDPNQVVNACLEGTRLGIFTLLWDIICPSCRISSTIQETLAAIKDHGSCEACNLNFSVDFAESVEMVFKIHAEIRDVKPAIYCIGGPAWSRHVVAQVRLAAGERFACELTLTEGAYVVRGPQLPFTINFRVVKNIPLNGIELSLSTLPSAQRILLATGSQVIQLYNDSTVDQQVRIERRASRHDAFSAAQASSTALFREIFPDEILSADQIISVGHIIVMRVQICDTKMLYDKLGDSIAFGKIRSSIQQILDEIKERSGAVVKTVQEGVLATFPDTLAALQAAHALKHIFHDSELRIRIAVHCGAAMVATLEDRLDYFGKTIQTLELLLESAHPQQILLTNAVADSEEIRQYLFEKQIKLELINYLQLPGKERVFQITDRSRVD